MINLIFDLDGCLINSLEVQKASFYGSYKEVVGDSNCPPFEEYNKYTGDSISNIFKRMGLPLEMVEVYRRISMEMVDKVVINRKCIELIEKYRNKGSKVAICTGKDRFRTLDILKRNKIEHLFDVLVCSDDVKEPKPSPISLNVAIKKLGVDKKDCLYIGDGYNDILCANNAKVMSVLTTWYGDCGVKGDANYVVNCVSELDSIIEHNFFANELVLD